MVGRSLGKMAANELLSLTPEIFEIMGIFADDIAAIVSAACLAHDIGNPPFGHSGEDAISEYFKHPDAEPFLEDLQAKEIQDLKNFEGNAMGFRLLTHTLPFESDLSGGLQLTYATLGAFTKYPREACCAPKQKKNASEKKYGIFQSEVPVFREIADSLQLISSHRKNDLIWKRHPLAFLVEAADDICYMIMDLEDGFKMHLVGFKEAKSWLLDIISGIGMTHRLLSSIHTQREQLGYLRAKAINSLVTQVAEEFIKQVDSILAGNFDDQLMNNIPSAEVMNTIRNVSFEKIYAYHKVTEIEAAGFDVIHGLLDAFLHAVFFPESKRNRKIRQLIRPAYHEKTITSKLPDYERIMLVVQYVAGMTDTFALNTYRTIKGISLPTC